jgi:integrase/recombinase XerC
MLEDDFKTYLESLDLAEKSIRNYMVDLVLFGLWFREANDEDISAETITPVDIKQYRQWMIAQQYSPATINRRMAMARHLAKMVGITEKIKGVTEVDPGPKWLDKKESDKLLRAAYNRLQRLTGRRDYAIIVILLNTGLRVSELCSLRLEDVSISDRKGSLKVMGKGQKTRTIPLNSNARTVLKWWFDNDQLLAGLQPRTVQRVLEDLSHATRLQITPHILRHTFAKSLIDSGVSIEKVAMLLGHANLNTTKVYIVPGQRDLETAVETIC